MIKLSEEAAKEIKRLRQQEGIGEEFALRCGCVGGGCSGLSYTLGFDKEIMDTDISEEQHGITVICDNKSNIYLSEATLEFSKELINGGFRFINPLAKSTCGCGKSFS